MPKNGEFISVGKSVQFSNPRTKTIRGFKKKTLVINRHCNRGLMIYDMPNSAATLAVYLREKGYKRYVVSNECSVCYTVRDFCKEYPEGKYIVLTSNHAIPVIDGNYYDSTDSGMDIPQYYWKKER